MAGLLHNIFSLKIRLFVALPSTGPQGSMITVPEDCRISKKYSKTSRRCPNTFEDLLKAKTNSCCQLFRQREINYFEVFALAKGHCY